MPTPQVLVCEHALSQDEGIMAVTKTQLHKVITKLGDVKVELLRLRADLLPEERPTASEKRQIAQGRREIERGGFVTLAELYEEVGV